MRFYQLIILLGLFTFLISASCESDEQSPGIGSEHDANGSSIQFIQSLSPGGNSWIINDITKNETLISVSGINNWADQELVIRTYFKVATAGQLHLGFKGKVNSGSSSLSFTIGNDTEEITIGNTDYDTIPVGVFTIDEPGYHFIELVKTSDAAVDISEFFLGGPITDTNLIYVKDEFYWGRRGPSVHLGYEMPENKDIEWFYNEITVPEGEDVIGSYFMANGFNEGYFGMQVNSEAERRVLFSVWSPYDTQNPNDIPEDYKIELLGFGEGVTVGEFGNEGSGGQSYLVFNWEPGKTYKFLLKGEPTSENKTDYTAYFYAPELDQWKLIASFRRPYTSTHLTRFHSFLENFDTKTGFIPRKGMYGNQWVKDTEGEWYELTKATFAADGTARSGNRLDYAGGSEGNQFFMHNCGFFSDNTPLDSQHTRQANGIVPTIDFNTLEVPDIPDTPEYINKSGWQVVDFSSEATSGEGSNGLSSLILDNDPSTYWHSCWSGCTEAFDYPHFLTIDMGSAQAIEGLAIVQRNGSRKVKDLEILIGNDNTNWQSLGDYILLDNAGIQTLGFGHSFDARYIKLKMNAAFDGSTFASMAELWAF